MLKILDRYLIREILLPFFIVLVVLTFVLMIPPILQQGEKLIEKGVEWSIVARVMLTLMPQALGLTIPMAVLVGILIGLGRMAADREFVALQACGVSLFRLLRPIALFALVATAATAYVMIVALPESNQTFREITFGVVAAHAESDVKPRVFFEEFPNRVMYVRDLPADGGWRDVFLADATRGGQTSVYFAKEGRLIVNREQRSVMVELKNGTVHSTQTAKPDAYDWTDFNTTLINLDADTVFPRVLAKGVPEMSIAELRASMADVAKHGDPGYYQRFMIQQKFSFPAACLVLALIGLALGFNNRKDGKLAGFVLGFIVIFVYYILLWTTRALAIAGWMSAPGAPWVPNILLGAVGVLLAMRRAESADRPFRFSMPRFWRRKTKADDDRLARGTRPGARSRSRVVVVVRVPHMRAPRPNLLDLYISRQYLAIFFMGVVSLLGIFYISTFMDLADKLFRGSATTALLLRYFYFATPQFVYYVIPMSALVATLVTIGLMTKNSELVVMKACGISLYRAAVPLVLFALVGSALLFGLQERVLASSNREADRLNRLIRGQPPQSYGALNRRWLVGQNGDIYHFDFFDSGTNRFARFTAYHVNEQTWRLESLTYAPEVALVRQSDGEGRPEAVWEGRNGWVRDFSTARRKGDVTTVVRYTPFAQRRLPLEPPSYFKNDEPDAERMTYGELKEYIAQLQTSGFNVIPNMVALQRKVAFPFVTLIMTVLAVPFAVTTGRRGALYGIGVGIVLAIVYWIALSVFVAVGAAGVMPPMLAAWAPNILFGAAALYLVLTVRT